MNETDLIRFVSEHRVFARVRAQSAESALRASEAAIAGGIRLIEVGLVTPGSFRVISDLRRSLGDRTVVGAGSVMNYDLADRAIKSGAQFLSFPHTSAPLVEQCRRWRVPAIAGALTPTEVATATSLEVPLVTVYPVESVGGAEYFRRLTWNMPDARLAAGGGVGPENIVDYFNAGAYAIVAGASLFPAGDLRNENYIAIAERARGILRLAGVA
jgi:2-dehydro-3-deoxyphosphogluconate aldolase/(4S)-4-hydroxy-2-oxoglutarate aldolase